jgi:type II secretory pathway pseudopilin PulG
MRQFSIFNFQFSNSSGQTLIEVVAALGISIVVVTAIAITVVSSLSNTNFSQNQHFATQYGQQAMEHVRFLRDTDWSSFSAKEGNYCLYEGSTDLIRKNESTPFGCQGEGYASNTNVGIFAREVQIDRDSVNCGDSIPPDPTPTPTTLEYGREVRVITSWNDSKCPAEDLFCHRVTIVSCLSDYVTVPTPGINP